MAHQAIHSSGVGKSAMVYIDYAVLSESLSDFGYSMPENDVLMNKVNTLATEFNLTVDDFIDEVVASAVNMKKTEIDLGILEHLEAELSKKLKRNLDRVLTPSSSTSRRVLGERHVNECSLNVSSMEMDTSSYEDFGSTQLTGKYRAFAPVASSPSNAKYQSRLQRNVVVREMQGQMFVSSSTVGGSVAVSVLSSIPSSLYAIDKPTNIIDAKCGRLASFASRCRQANPQVPSWSVPVPGSSSSEYVYGEIVRDLLDDLQLSDQCVSLLMDDEAGTVIELDLTRLPEVTIFPGQMVALLGSFENGNRFMATHQFFPIPLPLSTLGRPVNDENLRLWCACGPFTSNDNCSYEQLCDLLEMVKQQQPHVLILMGPFVERKNAFMRSPQFPEQYENVMDELMRKIALSLEGCRTELIIQPAPFRDACSTCAFPTPPFKVCSDFCKKFGRRFHSVPEPCVVRINGVELALTTSEIISHLSKNEWHRSEDQENRDRIARLASHMLEQSSLYPLFPPALPSSIEECIRICNLYSAPHVIVCPSVLASFIKVVNKTVIVNPGTTARGGSGTFLRCEFGTSIVKDATDLPDCSRFEIVQL
ncbi:hypothetical protein KIN20_020085 [Parelaphostrongylus tenuis]|uniref:DNA polymerase alpha subunit B n=1 Tax=Parelaphostrongylus tenuis TaxID=148309 RepID=A0AAD5N3Q2_PARTN|nr:hypothetical protein KIN20_020085 [Parelaphostrongylus tenuis]